MPRAWTYRAAAPVRRSQLRRQLNDVRHRVSAALQAAGVTFDPADRAVVWARDEGHYAAWQLPYSSESGAGEGLRPTIKIELNYAPLCRPRGVAAGPDLRCRGTRQPPEVPDLACVSIVETAAEKLVSLTGRTAMEMADAGRDRDPTLARHIYDLHTMHELIDPAIGTELACASLAEDHASDAGRYSLVLAGRPGGGGRSEPTGTMAGEGR